MAGEHEFQSNRGSMGAEQGPSVPETSAEGQGTDAQNQQRPADNAEDLVRNHPLYKQLLEENIQRRLQFKELEAKLEGIKPQVKGDELKSEPKAGADGPMNDIETLRSELDNLKKTLESERLNNLRLSALKEQNLPNEMAKFLTATTAEEIAAQAKELASFRTPSAPKDNSDTGQSPQDAADSLRKRILDQIEGKPAKSESFYDPRFAATRGGGVVNRS